MKKTSKSTARSLPISQKAYEGFRERIKRINNWYALDPRNMLQMLDDYLAGDSEPGGGASMIHKIAFLFLREEIDRAKARSARARENARLRRERKERERAEAAEREAMERQMQACQDDTSRVDDGCDNEDLSLLPKQTRHIDEVTESIKRSWNEVRQMEAGGMPAKSALKFIDELRSHRHYR